jgi:hypothetical protein
MKKNIVFPILMLILSQLSTLEAQKSFSFSVGGNLAYLNTKRDFAQPGLSLKGTFSKAKFQIALQSNLYSIDRQIQVLKTSDINKFYHFNSIQCNLSAGYVVLNKKGVALIPKIGVALDRRILNLVNNYTVKPDYPNVITSMEAKQETKIVPGLITGFDCRISLSSHLGLEIWSHFQIIPESREPLLMDNLFKSNAWISGVGLYYQW